MLRSDIKPNVRTYTALITGELSGLSLHDGWGGAGGGRFRPNHRMQRC